MKKVITLLFIQLSLFTIHANAQQGEWTWMKGSSSASGTATYGTQGIPAPGNTPTALYEGARWTDLNGNFWTYGGQDWIGGYADLWKFDPITAEWTWVKGPGGATYVQGVWGTQGVSAPANTPGSREWSPACWTDLNGDLWLYGGLGVDQNNGSGDMSDLWKYNIATNEWTWVKGPKLANQAGTYGTIGVSDINTNPSGLHESGGAWCDNNGDFWFYGGLNYNYVVQDVLMKYNIATNTWTWMFGNQFDTPATYGTMGIPSPTNNPGSRAIYTSFKDAAGNLYSFAGYQPNGQGYYNDVWKYDVATNEWTWVTGEAGLGNGADVGALCEEDTSYQPKNRYENRSFWWDDCGNTWFFGGLNSSGGYHGDLWHLNLNTLKWSFVKGSTSNNVGGVFGTQGVSDPANRPSGRNGSMSWMDNEKNLWLFGGWASAGFMNDMWRYVPDSNCTYITCTQIIEDPNLVAFSAVDTTLCEKFCISFFDSSGNTPVAWQWTFEGGSPSTSSLQNPSNICYQDPGEFDVTLITTDSNGKMDTLTLDNYITVFSNPFAPIITQDGNTLTCSPSTTYQWQFNGVDIPGATNQTYDMLQSGLYTVIIADENGCLSQSSYKAILSGVEELNAANYFAVYPNPSSGDFVISFLNKDITGEVSIDVVNALGQILYLWKGNISSSFQKEIQLSNVADGIYFLQVRTETISLQQKILISK